MGHLPRLRELFAEDPSLALEKIDGGSLLFHLPDEEGRAIEVAELLISHGADRFARNAEGSTAAEHAEKMGFDVLADLLGKT
jgi:ankyrin repeat protein